MRRLVVTAVIGLVPLTAWAIDLSTAVENWTYTAAGADGNGGDDEAAGVAVDSTNSYLVAGWLDGAPDHGDDAWLAKLDADGNEVWTVLVDGGAVDGITRLSSADRFHAVAVDDADNVDVGGALSGSLADGYAQAWYVGEYDPTGTTIVWDELFQDSVSSQVQAAHGVAVDPVTGNVVGAGWSFRSPTIAGQWLQRRYVGTTGFLDAGPIYHNVGDQDFAPDQAWDVTVDDAGNVYAVGAIATGTAVSALDANLDWHVRKYDSTYTLEWERTWSGLSGHNDVARGVAVAPDGNIVVAGYTNIGGDNGDRTDNDWLVVKYDAATGTPLWEVTWESALDASEQAYAVDVDDDGNVLVGGYWIDGGVKAWRLAQLSDYDGAELNVLTWPSVGGDGAITAVDERDGALALAGWQSNGANRDVQVIVLDADTDGDGVGDSVDGCPDDAAKVEPLVCGCGETEVDADADGWLDCEDACPDLPEKAEDEGVCGCDEPDEDRDADGTEDCIDNCPDDPDKTELGVCGCGLPDNDSDGDGVLGCDDACSNTPAGTPVDDHGCPIGDGTDTDDTDTPDGGADGGGDEKGCGCSSSPVGASGLLALVALLAVRRRRA